MNIENLKLMQTMLTEIAAGTWKISSHAVYVGQDVEGSIKFDLWSWVENRNDDCGFSACAIGHATMDKRFTDLGWWLDVHSPKYENPVNGDMFGCWDAVETFFGIEYYTAQLLFMNMKYMDGAGSPINHVTPDMVNARIETLIQFGEEEFCARGYTQ